MKMYLSLEDLPDFLQNYVWELVGDDAAAYVRRHTPALGGRTLLDLANTDGLETAAKYLSKVGTKFGLTYGVEVPPNQDC